MLVQPRVPARVMKQHQRENAGRLGLVGHEAHQHARQADRLVAELAPHQRVGARGEVALVEDQIERGQDRAQPLGQVGVRRDRVGDAGPADLALRADEPLRHGGLRHEECARHLRGGEPAERPERERDLGLRRERRVAAGEEEPQAVVGYRAHVVLPLVSLLTGQERPEVPELALVVPVTPDAVDGPVARRSDDPGGRVRGHPVPGPALERDHEGILHRLLGEVEVAENADERGDRPSRLAPEQAVDVRRGRGYRAAPAAFEWTSEPADS